LTITDLYARLRDFENAEKHLKAALEQKESLEDTVSLRLLYNVAAGISARKCEHTGTVGAEVQKCFEYKKQSTSTGANDPAILFWLLSAYHRNWKDAQAVCITC
jgi:hypothetical protein